uniref:ATP-binding cassette, subfamily B (MDR/TAP), member 1 n=1 Tax=Kwoniella dejecticola CBS 10117 TaxID=1296121 RepID=A0A1A6A836_9TREE|nr:ATP-binding cassette, subfamily B (MDR/TAP), member 1 [Kwoniella dejecticola CBS 10117]OBR86224.1 ATP-binding cassette, subfamily B (MDR/TAP), member 1 [Kwoniella dejecticola CBS 10117]
MPSTSPSPQSLRTRDQPKPAFSRPPSGTNITTITNTTPTPTNSRYPPVSRDLTTPSPPRHIPATPPQHFRSHHRPQTPSTLNRAINTSLPLSPPTSSSASAVYYSSPPSAFPSHFHNTPAQDYELTPITPKRVPPSIHESPFDDRHSILHPSSSDKRSRAPDIDIDADGLEVMSTSLSDEDPFEYSDVRVSGGKQRTMPGYKFSSLSPRAVDEKGKELTFGPMLDQIALGYDSNQDHTRPISEYRRSLYPTTIPLSTYENHPDLEYPAEPGMAMGIGMDSPNKIVSVLASSSSSGRRRTIVPVRPTFRRLFALSSAREYILLLIPALVFSILSALVAPYMSMVIGDAFAIFATYPLVTGTATQADKDALRAGVRDTSLKLTIAGILAVLFNYLRGILWVWYGETVASRLRNIVYVGVSTKSMEWFDLGMGMKDPLEDGEGSEKKEAIGAGGLMSKFTRETDDVRLACALSAGAVVMNLGTFLLCFILAMVKSPVLAIVTLSTIPLVVLTQIITQVAASPLLAEERRAFAEASTNVERVTSAISTVKAHNAQSVESGKFRDLIAKGKKSLVRQGLVWGTSSGMTDFLLLGTFVLGFWYGAKIVRDGKASSGDVMTCFWACLFSATYLQQVVPHLTGLTKGKNSLASLLTIIKEYEEDPSSPRPRPRPTSNASDPFSPTSPTSSIHSQRPRTVPEKQKTLFFRKNDRRNSGARATPPSIKGIIPTRCHGEFNFQNISFFYPSRPENLVLRDISLFIPPGETTFIVGGSGSGKSTIAQILLRLYDPFSGEITMDNQNFNNLDPLFTRSHIAAVQQGCILFDLSVHDNVALGLAGTPEDVTREEVVEACKMAMIHDFIESLPEGYETRLGTGGNSLSGGQRQRLAIARARIRDPTVLILDEATSALDPTSRIQVFQNLKSWRQNRTTIVITHDLSQIVADDFVYVMSNGIIAEQGFRVDLMKKPEGVFAEMAAEQAITPFPTKRISDETNWQDGLEEILGMEDEFDIEELLDDRSTRNSFRASTPNFGNIASGGIGGRSGSIYAEIMDGYSRNRSQHRLSTQQTPSSTRLSNAQKRLTWTSEDLHGGLNSNARTPSRLSHRPSSRISRSSLVYDYDRSPHMTVRSSFDTTSRVRPSFDSVQTPHHQNGLLHPGWVEKDGSPYSSNSRMSASVNLKQRQQQTLSQNLEDELKLSSNPSADQAHHLPLTDYVPAPLPGLAYLIKLYFPTLPHKWLLLLGCLGSVGHGITTPVWSFFLAKLMQIVGAGGTDTSSLTKFGAIILALCAVQGICHFISEWALITLSSKWSYQVRLHAFNQVLFQPKAFFDRSENSSERLVQILIKDVEDSRTLMSQVIGRIVTVCTMIGLGLIWAMVVNWQLTLIGIGLAPLFGSFFALNSGLMGRIETGHKAGREAVARTFYESISNIRGIRAMALDSAFQEKFDKDAINAKRLGDRAAWGAAVGGAIASGITLFAQALMNYAGSEFMIKDIMNYQQMLQVYNLVLFSLTFGSGMLDFIPTMAKARVAARDFNRLYLLSTQTDESKGDLRFPISGSIKFQNVQFAYPTRPDVPIFLDLSFSLRPGECVAIVGPSGCGKSTISALLQRLYEPSSGQIILEDKYRLDSSDIKWLRNNISVVNQSTNLFNASIAENISYGANPDGVTNLLEIQRSAKLANIHEFIQSLPRGYETNLGENANLISGGQAQRIQLARALYKNSNILILDECTSALDVDNARAVLDTIESIKETRTTIFITHSVEAMKRCDRILCLGEGRVLEDGSYQALINKGGVFAQLVSTGEWE